MFHLRTRRVWGCSCSSDILFQPPGHGSARAAPWHRGVAAVTSFPALGPVSLLVCVFSCFSFSCPRARVFTRVRVFMIAPVDLLTTK